MLATAVRMSGEPPAPDAASGAGWLVPWPGKSGHCQCHSGGSAARSGAKSLPEPVKP
jgi:hypothetical protein